MSISDAERQFYEQVMAGVITNPPQNYSMNDLAYAFYLAVLDGTIILGGGGGGGGSVNTVNGVAPVGGNVTLTKANLSLGNVDNTADTAKPVSTAQNTAINAAVAAVTAASIGAVPTSRQVNLKALSADVTLAATDVGAVPHVGSAATVRAYTVSTTGVDQTTPVVGTATANTIASRDSSGRIVAADGDGSTAGQLVTQNALAGVTAGLVPTSRTVAGKALTANVSIAPTDIGAAQAIRVITDGSAVPGGSPAGLVARLV